MNDFSAADTYICMVYVGSNGGFNGSLVEVALCFNTLNGGRMSRVHNRMKL